MKDPYAALGLPRTASKEELTAKYTELKSLYGEQRFKPGEEGNEGARLLHELEESWLTVQKDIDERDNAAAFGPVSDSAATYSRVDALIREGKYSEAQSLLDSITDRQGEWHYFQSIVFYKREWLAEAKTQLEMAIQCEPNNAKYKNALDKLNLVIGNPGANPGNMNNGTFNNAPPPVQPAPMNSDDGMNACSTCCCAYLLTDCCCNMMRCM